MAFVLGCIFNIFYLPFRRVVRMGVESWEVPTRKLGVNYWIMNGLWSGRCMQWNISMQVRSMQNNVVLYLLSRGAVMDRGCPGGGGGTLMFARRGRGALRIITVRSGFIWWILPWVSGVKFRVLGTVWAWGRGAIRVWSGTAVSLQVNWNESLVN